MKLISYNIQYGYGSDGCYDLTRCAKLIDGADIIALQEVERHWQRTDGDDQPEILSRLLPDHYWVYGPAFDMDASEKQDGRVVNRRRQFGTMVLSKLPIVWSRLHALPLRRTLRPLNTRNAALECMIRTPAGPVRVVSLHLAHIAVEERLEQIDYLLAEHRRAPSDGGPWSGADDEPQRNWSNGEPDWSAAAAFPDVKLHLYGKLEPRPGRKMGHLTCLAQDAGSARETVIAARNALSATRGLATRPIN